MMYCEYDGDLGVWLIMYDPFQREQAQHKTAAYWAEYWLAHARLDFI